MPFLCTWEYLGRKVPFPLYAYFINKGLEPDPWLQNYTAVS